MAEAIVNYLAFSREHQALAQSIAASASERAAFVGSGRVGRTRVLPLEERAQLAKLNAFGQDDDLYRLIKVEVRDTVDTFLDVLRPNSP